MPDVAAVPPTVSVVIPCYNTAGTIRATLDSVAASTAAVTEVICVDDGSTDDTLDVLRVGTRATALPLRLLVGGRNQGAAMARNRGAREAQGELILFLDADVVLGPTAIERLVARVTRSGAAAAVALYEPWSAQPGLLAAFQAVVAHMSFDRVDADDSPYLGTQCALVRRDRFVAAGGFDERYRAATVEDFELGNRLRRAGHRVVIASSARIVHNHRYTWRSFTRNYFAKARAVTELMLDADPKDRGLGTGYASVGNLAAAALLALQLVALPWGHRRGRRTSSVLPTLILLLSWLSFLRQTRRVHGRWYAAGFTVLRAYVTLVAVAGTALGLGTRAERLRGGRGRRRLS